MTLPPPPKSVDYYLSDIGYDVEPDEGALDTLFIEKYRLDGNGKFVLAKAHSKDEALTGPFGQLKVWFVLSFPMIEGIGGRRWPDYSRMSVSEQFDVEEDADDTFKIWLSWKSHDVDPEQGNGSPLILVR